MRNYIIKMQESGLVTEIHNSVSTRFEAPKLAFSTDRLLLFQDLDGKKAVMNLLSSREALSVALGIPVKELVPKLAKSRYDGKIKECGSLKLRKVDLDEIPIMQNYPGEPGRYINSGVVFSRYQGI
jgi:UbiD family decarboxylase